MQAVQRTELLSAEWHSRGDRHTQKEAQKRRQSASEHADQRSKAEQCKEKRRLRKGEKLPGQQKSVEVEQLRLPAVSLPLETAWHSNKKHTRKVIS